MASLHLLGKPGRRSRSVNLDTDANYPSPTDHLVFFPHFTFTLESSIWGPGDAVQAWTWRRPRRGARVRPTGRGRTGSVRGVEAVRVRRRSWNVRVRGPRAPPARRRLAGGARRGKPLANLLPLRPVDVGAGAAARRAEGQIVPTAGLRAPPRLASPRPELPGPGGPGGGGGAALRLLDPPLLSWRPEEWIALLWEK